MIQLEPYRSNEEKEKEDARRLRFFIIIAIVFVMIVMVLTFGWFYMQEKQKEEGQKRQEEERRKEEERERQLKRLAEVGVKIAELQLIKERIKKLEKRIVIWTRIGLGVILVAINWLYKYYNIYPFHFEADIGKLLNLNAAILTAYSFLAFITFGTINNFAKRMKAILAALLREKNLHSLEELESLMKERETLKKELENLQ